MFKKKPAPVPPRARNRVSDQAPRNTAVFSYHAARSASLEGRERTSVAEQEPQRKRLPRFGIQRLRRTHIMSVLAIFILFMLSVGLSSTPKIVILGDASNTFALQDTIVYKKAAHRLFGASIANNNKLTINTESVATQLKQQFPEVHAVSISLPFFGRQPTVYIQPATPQVVLATPNGQFILDSNGRALALATSATVMPEDRPVPIVTDQSGLTFKKGDVALSSKSVSFITEIAGQLEAKQIKTETWTLPSAASELDVKVSGQPYTIKFNLQGEAREQAGTFLAARDQLIRQGETPSSYVDVRVAGRAYYK